MSVPGSKRDVGRPIRPSASIGLRRRLVERGTNFYGGTVAVLTYAFVGFLAER